MCGICGVYGFEDNQLLTRMMTVLQHRGPDDSGSHTDKNLMLGHKRLNIIDLSEKGRQPLYNEDGHRFRSRTDSEVILHAYEQYGKECLPMLNGMFAFAIWDSNKKQLLLARDRHGIKSLYYTLAKGNFLFASEIKSLLMYEDIRRELDHQSMHQFLNLRYLPAERTMFRDIKKMKSGHVMTVAEDGIESYEEFWSPRFEIEDKGLDHYVAALQKSLEDAVERHMISDVPVGVYLSGGLDSSTILAMATKHAQEPIMTFTMGFGEESDEIEDAELISRHFNTDHRSIIVKTDILKDYPRMIWHMDSPKRNLYTYYLSQFMRDHVKVVLSGLGGDELFGGYTWKYVTANIVLNHRKKLQEKETKDRIIESARILLEYQSNQGMIEDDRFLEYIKRLNFIDSNTDLYLMVQTLDEVFQDDYLMNRIYADNLIGNIHRPYESIREIYERFLENDNHFIDQILLADYSIKMQDDFLFVEDGMSMAHSLETRVPFLDNELVDLSFRIPHKYKIYNITDSERGAHIGKYVLRKAMEGKLPQEVFDKRKQGFGTDVFLTYKSEIKDFASKLLPESNIVKDKLIKKEFVDKILGHYLSRNLIKHYS
jgi:asparagine synthase (glutamine-hydrolysing)